MTIDNDVNKITRPGNGVATVFSFEPMVLFSNTDGTAQAVVVITDGNGIETPVLEGVGPNEFAITITGGKYPGTGSVIYPADQITPIDSNSKITIKSVVPLTQKTALDNQGGYFAEVQETAFDRGVKISQQQQEELDRVVKAALSDDVVDLTLPTVEQRRNQLFGFDDNGEPVAAANGGGVVSVAWAPVVSNITVDGGLVVAGWTQWTLDNLRQATDQATARSAINAPNRPTTVDNRMLKADGVAGEYQQTGIEVDDSNRVAGSGTTIVTDTTTARTLGASDLGRTIVFTNAGAITVTLPEVATEDLIDGFHCQCVQARGAGQITFEIEGTDNLNHPFGAFLSAGEGAMIYVFKQEDGDWIIAGGVV